MRTWIKLIGCFLILWEPLIINQREQKPLHHHLIMGERLAGSTPSILAAAVFSFISKQVNVHVWHPACVYHASIYYLLFSLITFLTMWFDYRKPNTPQTYFKICWSISPKLNCLILIEHWGNECVAVVWIGRLIARISLSRQLDS